jgi:hypothetical protein
LPEHEFGIEDIALVGQWRYRDHRSVAKIHQALRGRQVTMSERMVTNLLAHYDEWVTAACSGCWPSRAERSWRWMA